MNVLSDAPESFTETRRASSEHQALHAPVENDAQGYFGLTTGADHRVHYSGPLKSVELEGHDIGEFLTPLLRWAPAAHVIIQPEVGLVILALSRTDFLGFQFMSPIERAHLARFLSAMCKARKARIIEEYNAVELA